MSVTTLPSIIPSPLDIVLVMIGDHSSPLYTWRSEPAWVRHLAPRNSDTQQGLQPLGLEACDYLGSICELCDIQLT